MQSSKQQNKQTKVLREEIKRGLIMLYFTKQNRVKGKEGKEKNQIRL